MLLQGGEKLTYDQPNPFVGEGKEELAAVAYRRAISSFKQHLLLQLADVFLSWMLASRPGILL